MIFHRLKRPIGNKWGLHEKMGVPLATRAHTTKQCDIRRRRNTFDNPVQAVGAAQGKENARLLHNPVGVEHVRIELLYPNNGARPIAVRA